MDIEQLKFPIGDYSKTDHPTAQQLEEWINNLEHFPTKLEQALKDVLESQLYWRYRPDGWTIRQVVHHCADSHMNCLIRFKLALTEETPVIKPYFEAKWAELPDSKTGISDSLLIIKGVHARLTTLIKSLTDQQLAMAFFHPENEQSYTLKEIIGLYSWHSMHHLAHVVNGIESKGKYN